LGTTLKSVSGGTLNVADPTISTRLAISARLVGADEDGGHVQYADFLRFCNAMNDCLKRAESIVTGGQGARIHYRIVSLRDSSAGIELEAIRSKKGTDYRGAVRSLFLSTVVALQTGGSVDHRLTPDTLERFRELYKAPQKTKEIWIGGKKITTRYLANIEELLKPSFESEGSVTGILERLNVHDKNEFSLFPPLWSAVTCVFPEKLFEQVREAIKRNVTVFGKLMYPPDRPYPMKVHVERMEVHPPDDKLPTLRELRGIFKGCLEGKTATEFVRAIRDERD
jgi:hypothetical protein